MLLFCDYLEVKNNTFDPDCPRSSCNYVDQQRPTAQFSYIACLSCTASECIPDLLSLLSCCVHVNNVSESKVGVWLSFKGIQGKHCLSLGHTRRSILFSQQTCPVFRIQTQRRWPRGGLGWRWGALLYPRVHSQTVS